MEKELNVGDIWVSDTHPGESFEITEVKVEYRYLKENSEYTPETCPPEALRYSWKRTNNLAFNAFLCERIGRTKNIYPYQREGSSAANTLLYRIQLFDMHKVSAEPSVSRNPEVRSEEVEV